MYIYKIELYMQVMQLTKHKNTGTQMQIYLWPFRLPNTNLINMGETELS